MGSRLALALQVDQEGSRRGVALADHVEAGMHLAFCQRNVAAARADLLAELRGWSPVAGIQVEYSLAERSADREFLPMVEALGLGAALWSPLGGGLLTGKYRDGSKEGRMTGLGGVLLRKEAG